MKTAKCYLFLLLRRLTLKSEKQLQNFNKNHDQLLQSKRKGDTERGGWGGVVFKVNSFVLFPSSPENIVLLQELLCIRPVAKLKCFYWGGAGVNNIPFIFELFIFVLLAHCCCYLVLVAFHSCAFGSYGWPKFETRLLSLEQGRQ